MTVGGSAIGGQLLVTARRLVNNLPMPVPPPPRPPLTDSPWFWVYTFATFALVMLVLIGPKVASRQSQEERKFQGRTRAQQQKLGEEPAGGLSEPGRTWLTLTPIYILLGTMIALGWGTLWWQRWRARPTPAKAEKDAG